MAGNLPIAFGAILAGGVLLDAAIKGAPISSVIRGQAQAAGSSVGAAGPAPASSSGPAVNPFARAQGLQIGRTDQGVDASMSPGSPILAPFAGTVTAINPGWYQGQPQLVLQGAPGTPFAHRFLYLAEQITPSVKVGQSVNAGDPLATYAPSGTGIEMGWASDAAGTTLARAQRGYGGGAPSVAGSSFRSFLASLGVKV